MSQNENTQKSEKIFIITKYKAIWLIFLIVILAPLFFIAGMYYNKSKIPPLKETVYFISIGEFNSFQSALSLAKEFTDYYPEIIIDNMEKNGTNTKQLNFIVSINMFEIEKDANKYVDEFNQQHSSRTCSVYKMKRNSFAIFKTNYLNTHIFYNEFIKNLL